MKNIFDIKRFGKLLKSDLFTKLPRIYPNIIALLAVVPILMILHYTGIFDAFKSFTPSSRLTLINVQLFVAMFMAPFIIYKTVNDRKRGVEFILRPASALEKLLSMIIVCTIVVPIITLISLLLLDYILYLLPGDFIEGTAIDKLLDNGEFLRFFKNYALMQSLAICGNLLFRRAKAALTIISCVGLMIIETWGFATIVMNMKIKNLFNPTVTELFSLVTGQDVSNMTMKELSGTNNNEDEDVVNINLNLSNSGSVSLNKSLISIQDDTTVVSTKDGNTIKIIKEYKEENQEREIPDVIKVVNGENLFVIEDYMQFKNAFNNSFRFTIHLLYYLFFAGVYVLSYLRIKKIKY